jgi:hypothetical protein
VTLDIDFSDRFRHTVFLHSVSNEELCRVSGETGVLELLGQLLDKHKAKLTDLKEIRANMEGESRVGILIGVSAANALNYCLGLKRASELEYPKQAEDGTL